MHSKRQKLISSRTIFPNEDHWKDSSRKKGFSDSRGTASRYKLLIEVPCRCGWAPGQETPAACPSCSSAVPGAAHMQAQPAEDTSQGGSREPQPRDAQHEKRSSPCSYSQGPLRQTTAAAPALMLEETVSNHTRTTTPTPRCWICSRSPSTNIQIFPPWSFIWTYLSPGFCTQFLFHPTSPLAIALSSWGTLTVPRAPLANHSTSVLQPV